MELCARVAFYLLFFLLTIVFSLVAIKMSCRESAAGRAGECAKIKGEASNTLLVKEVMNRRELCNARYLHSTAHKHTHTHAVIISVL